jgi:hypothetical protein
MSVGPTYGGGGGLPINDSKLAGMAIYIQVVGGDGTIERTFVLVANDDKPRGTCDM